MRPRQLDMYGPDPDTIIKQALGIMEARLRYPAKCQSLSAPQVVKDFLALRMAHLEHEVFDVLFVDARNRLIEAERMFTGTLTQTSVYPREVVKAALRHNAAACILAHNHPSGTPDASQADRHLTRALKEALALVDVQVLDHIIIAGRDSFSFAERGLL